MSKFKVGDKVLVEAEITDVKSYVGHNVEVKFKDNGIRCIAEDYLIDYSKIYEQGLQDAWELALKVSAIPAKDGIPHDDCIEMFGTICGAEIIRNNTPQEALAKIEAYEECQQIHRNEIVELPNRSFGVVTYADVQLDKYTVIDYMGRAKNDYNATQLKKTVRHIDIEHLLEQISGNE